MPFFGRCAWSVLVVGLAVATPVRGEEPAQARPGRLDDPFLQNLVGSWDVSRRIRGTVVRNTLGAEWVLQHRFVQIHMKDAADPPEYEALVLIGFDAGTQRYVAHWCDSYGGQFSAVAYGKREGNAIDFVFQYPDGPFHNTFFWNQDSGSWRLLMESEVKDGTRTFFAEDTVRRKPAAQALVPRQLEPLAFLLGVWEATGSGQPGTASGSATFAPGLQGRVLIRTSNADYPASASGPASRHEDLMVVHVNDRGGVQADYFDSEGHVIHYAVSLLAPGEVSLVSETQEGAPRYRLTYKLAPGDILKGQFEIAPPGKPDAFSPYLALGVA